MKTIIIGMGNVGQHLANKFIKENISPIQCYNRSTLPDSALRNQPWGKLLTYDWENLDGDAELVILSVSDDVIPTISKNLPKQLKEKALVVHTSGINGRNHLCNQIKRKGIFYPLNSFTIGASVKWCETPIFITAEDKDVRLLKRLAGKISNSIYEVDEDQKSILHACAVMVNNFPNALFSMAEKIMLDHRMSLNPLLPLIKTTVEKIQTDHPKNVQTGPAIRSDQKTINRHLEILKDYPEEKEIYKRITHYINPESIKHENR